MPRWVCPLCNSVKLAPTRPRADDARRFCLACSGSTGKMVQRVWVAREKTVAARTVRRDETLRAKKLSAQEQAALTAATYPEVLTGCFDRWRGLKAFTVTGGVRAFPSLTQIVVRRSQTKRHTTTLIKGPTLIITAGLNRAEGFASLLRALAWRASHGHMQLLLCRIAGEEVLAHALTDTGRATLVRAFEESLAYKHCGCTPLYFAREGARLRAEWERWREQPPAHAWRALAEERLVALDKLQLEVGAV